MRESPIPSPSKSQVFRSISQVGMSKGGGEEKTFPPSSCRPVWVCVSASPRDCQNTLLCTDMPRPSVSVGVPRNWMAADSPDATVLKATSKYSPAGPQAYDSNPGQSCV